MNTNFGDAPKKWEYWLYPQLQQFPLPDRSRALQKAKESSFDAIELIGFAVALVITVSLTRYSAAGLGLVERIGAALANFILAIPLLILLAGPLYVRRTRRGLKAQLHNQKN
jgi:hypothetical protein